jgi:hypothetical protein
MVYPRVHMCLDTLLYCTFTRVLLLRFTGKLVATGSDDGSVICWNPKTGQATQHFKGIMARVNFLFTCSYACFVCFEIRVHDFLLTCPVS